MKKRLTVLLLSILLISVFSSQVYADNGVKSVTVKGKLADYQVVETVNNGLKGYYVEGEKVTRKMRWKP
ncbi:hypothetical protein [Paenibacillus sp. NRS-1760]|uniref:hypothetical protein n=1 Tax=Paenibacillus sp. NRS-1760 TaxID=3233902 RepID=UPI003D29CC42